LLLCHHWCRVVSHFAIRNENKRRHLTINVCWHANADVVLDNQPQIQLTVVVCGSPPLFAYSHNRTQLTCKGQCARNFPSFRQNKIQEWTNLLLLLGKPDQLHGH
jgi:hypothetical protein